MDKKLRIAVNTRLLLSDKMDGIGYFACETLRRITIAHPEVEFHFLFDRPYDRSFIFSDNVKPVVLFPPARHPLLWYWWFEWSVAHYLRKNNFDLFLSPDGYCSLSADTPTLAIQHDIAFEHYPGFVPPVYSVYYKYFVPRFMKHATRIATVSEYSKADIMRAYSIPADKIDVIYNAAKDAFKPISQYTAGKAYLICVGSIHPRKNLKNMLLAFDQFKKTTPTADHKFLVVGAYGWQNSELHEVIANMQFRDEVIFMGRQPLDILAKLVAGAFALLYVSLFEGFGVPPVEAMQCGVPAITSNTSSMPEICGDAALLVNPLDADAIAAAIKMLATDTGLYGSLTAKGFQQSQKYSWAKSAELLWESGLRAMR
jgi:glycosyltransferase involved in cell wall biosynthesis